MRNDSQPHPPDEQTADETQQANQLQREHSALCLALADREPTAAGRLYLLALATIPVGQHVRASPERQQPSVAPRPQGSRRTFPLDM